MIRSWGFGYTSNKLSIFHDIAADEAIVAAKMGNSKLNFSSKD